jgi:hypothetical protein
MTNNTLTIGAGLGGIAFWNTRKTSRLRVQAAADQAGVGHLVPAQPAATTTLRSAMESVAKQHFGIRRKHPYSIRQLEEPGTFEAVQVTPGRTANQYVLKFSAGINGNWQVDLLSCVECDELGKTLVLAKLRAAVEDERDYLPATVVSAIMVRALHLWGATLLKDDGGVWFLPGIHLDKYRAFASHIRGNGDGPEFKCTQFEIASDPDTIDHVLSSLRSEVMAGVTEIMNDVMSAEGGMRDRSIQIRTDRANEFLRKVQLYEQFTGRALTDLTGAVEQAKQALAVNRLLSASI